MARIAIGGFQHETNTFAPALTPFREFERHDSWPGLTRGAGLIDAVAGINIPIAGFIAAAKGTHDLLPMIWCAAEPSSFVTRDAFERIVQKTDAVDGLLGGFSWQVEATPEELPLDLPQENSAPVAEATSDSAL